MTDRQWSNRGDWILDVARFGNLGDEWEALTYAANMWERHKRPL